GRRAAEGRENGGREDQHPPRLRAPLIGQLARVKMRLIDRERRGFHRRGAPPVARGILASPPGRGNPRGASAAARRECSYWSRADLLRNISPTPTTRRTARLMSEESEDETLSFPVPEPAEGH